MVSVTLDIIPITPFAGTRVYLSLVAREFDNTVVELINHHTWERHTQVQLVSASSRQLQIHPEVILD